ERLPCAAREVTAEFWPRQLDLTFEDRVKVGRAPVRHQRRVRATTDHPAAAPSELRGDLDGAAVLHVENPDPNHVGVDVEVDAFDVRGDDADLPVRWGEGGHGGETDGSVKRPEPEERGRPGEAPEGVGEARADEGELHPRKDSMTGAGQSGAMDTQSTDKTAVKDYFEAAPPFRLSAVQNLSRLLSLTRPWSAPTIREPRFLGRAEEDCIKAHVKLGEDSQSVSEPSGPPPSEWAADRANSAVMITALTAPA